MNTVSSIQNQATLGGLASLKSKTKVLPNTRNKMLKLFRDTPNFRKMQSYAVPQNIYNKPMTKIKRTPSPKKTNDIDDLLYSMKKMNVKSPKKKTPSPKKPNTYANDANDINDLVNMFGKVQLKKQRDTKTTTKKKTNTRPRMKKMDVDISDDDFLSNLFSKKMNLRNKKTTQRVQNVQPLRRS